jgi:hypothetical protein
MTRITCPHCGEIINNPCPCIVCGKQIDEPDSTYGDGTVIGRGIDEFHLHKKCARETDRNVLNHFLDQEQKKRDARGPWDATRGFRAE